ncbi:MAG TPA: T9SS type A sorting domain-containing protein [Ferruginibacter sp.]|nr:T9SS type A sorting domain-containing protein [Ferruginibacter sp.]
MRNHYPTYVSKHRSAPIALALFFCCLLQFNAGAQAPVDPSSIIGKVVCGYQGWFTCTGDAAPPNRWSHWCAVTAPQPGISAAPNPNLSFEAYPDISIYNTSNLYATNLGAHGDGTTSKLFSSYKQAVTNKHFELMQTHGIDGAALQRFIAELLNDGAYKALRDSVAVHVKNAAEAYSRMFYITYDLSGFQNVSAANDAARFAMLQNDWGHTIDTTLGLLNSPMYAKQGGKPVVQLWGIGYNTVIGTTAEQIALINWFKARGCYVILGVPQGWRTGTGSAKPSWTSVYNAANMISPWAVGVFNNVAGADSYKTNYLNPDLTYCNTNSLAFQPVLFPGFAWSNWNGGTQNQIPRIRGDFFWRQATNIRSLGITSGYIAMFDEYDEGTAILNLADGYNSIPTNQYFLTSCADGTYISPDFYLRLANKVSRVIKGLDASVVTHTVPYSVGPMYFRTSNETKYDPTPTWTSTTDALTSVTTYGLTTGTPTCATILEMPRRGQYSLKIMGNDRSTVTSNAYFRVYDVNIAVTSTTDLSFYTYPLNALGRYISVDLVMTDATTLRGSGATDIFGVSMHPATGRGTVGSWTKTTSNIGFWLAGKTIDKILVAYDNAPSTGDFSGYVEDIAINEQSFVILPLKLLSFTARPERDNVQVQWQTASESDLGKYEVERSIDGIHFTTISTVYPLSGTGTKNYSYIDANALVNFSNADKLYYRLKIADTDGKYTYSEVRKISTWKQHVFAADIINPMTDKINMNINAPADGNMHVLMTDISGKTFINTSVKVQKGVSVISLDNKTIAKGMYIMKLTLQNEVLTYKIEK